MTDIGDGDLFDRRRRAATHPATAAADTRCGLPDRYPGRSRRRRARRRGEKYE